MYSRPRTILLITFDVRRRGGIERLSLHVARSLGRSGRSVQVLYPAAWFTGTLGRWLGRLTFLLRLFPALARADGVLCMHALLVGPTARVRGILRTVGLCRLQPLHCWMHGIEVWGAAINDARPRLEGCDSLVASSRFTRDRVLETPGRWPPVTVIHPMADLVPEEDPPAELPVHPRLVTIARLDVGWGYKGHRLVIAALAGLRRRNALPAALRWDVVGDGNDRENLEAEASALGIADLVTFHGDLPDDQVRAILRASSAMVMPSPYSPGRGGRAAGEGFGIAYLEAAFAGRMSIACRSGGQADLIDDGVNGLLVEPDAEAVAQAIQAALSDPHAFRRLGDAARAKAIAGFSSRRFDAAIRELVDGAAAAVKADVPNAGAGSRRPD